MPLGTGIAIGLGCTRPSALSIAMFRCHNI